MASQQPPMRQWYRLPSIARPTAPPPQRQDPPAQPQPSAPQPRLPSVRPTLTLRPPTPPIPPPQEPVPPPTVAPPPAAASPPISAQPPPPPAANTSSVPTSPVIRAPATTSSMPTSPAQKSSPNSTTLPFTSSSSVPPSPKPKTSVQSSPPPSQAPVKTLSISPLPPPHSSPAPMKTVSNSPVAPPQPSPPPATTTTVVARSAAPSLPQPQIIKQLAGTPSPSSKTNSISNPPSPLTLPPAQIRSDAQRETKIPAETEKKTVVVQETIEKPKLMTQNSNGDFQRNVNQTHKKDNEISKEKGKHKNTSDSEDFVMRVITIAGENKGAVMEFSPSNKKKGNPGGTESGEEEGRLNLKKNEKTQKSPMSNTFINSNVQGVNNSILFNSALSHHDPGIHLSLSRKSNGKD